MSFALSGHGQHLPVGKHKVVFSRVIWGAPHKQLKVQAQLATVYNVVFNIKVLHNFDLEGSGASRVVGTMVCVSVLTSISTLEMGLIFTWTSTTTAACHPPGVIPSSRRELGTNSRSVCLATITLLL